MSLAEIRANLGVLLNEANQKGAFGLEQANAAIQCLMGLDSLLKVNQPVAMSESDPIPPDPSKPKP